MEWMPQAIREGIFTILFISGPLVILAAGLGLAVGILQAATQVQEQTLGSAVKIIGLFLAIIIFGFYMFGYMRTYATENINRAFRLVPQLGNYIMPRKNFMEVPINEEELKPMEGPTALEPMPESNQKAPRLAGELALPETEIRADKNIGGGPLGLPQMQKKKVGDTNVIKQNPDGSPVKEAPKPAPTQAPKSPTPSILDEPLIQQSKPIQARPRKSLTDSLSKLKESINEFNEFNQEYEGAR